MPINISARVHALRPYLPGKAMDAIRLDSNENPEGPSPLVRAAIREAVSGINRYPDGSALDLKKSIGEFLKVFPEQVSVGNGSNELIDTLIRTYCESGDAIVVSQYAFIAYKLCAATQGVKTIESRVHLDFRADLSSMLEKIKSDESVKIAFLANPNNPTGTYNSRGELEWFLKEVEQVRDGSVLVVLDCAYAEYVTASDLPDPIPHLSRFSNLVVLRTFSKIFGLASLRVGCSVSSVEIANHLEKMRLPFNVNGLGLLAAQIALQDLEYVEQAKKKNAQGMRYLGEVFQRLGISHLESQGNFILVDTLKSFGKSALEVQGEFLALGLSIRPLANYGLPNSIRISLGTHEQLERITDAFKKIIL